MTPERRRRIEELFAAALRIDPAECEAWLRGACGDDEGLRAEVARLLDQHARATRERFPAAPEPAGRAQDRTGSWSPQGGPRPRRGAEPIDDAGAGSMADAGGFSPKAAIVAGPERYPISA